MKDTSLKEKLLFLKEWILENVRRPIRGFEHKRNPDGSWYSREQQVTATRFQAFNIAQDYIKRGKSPQDAIDILKHYS